MRPSFPLSLPPLKGVHAPQVAHQALPPHPCPHCHAPATRPAARQTGAADCQPPTPPRPTRPRRVSLSLSTECPPHRQTRTQGSAATRSTRPTPSRPRQRPKTPHCPPLLVRPSLSLSLLRLTAVHSHTLTFESPAPAATKAGPTLASRTSQRASTPLSRPSRAASSTPSSRPASSNPSPSRTALAAALSAADAPTPACRARPRSSTCGSAATSTTP